MKLGELYQAFGSLVITLAVMALLLYFPADTADWPRATWFLTLFAVAMVLAIGYIWRVDPELFVVRRRPQQGTKGWDLAYVAVTVVSLAAVLPVAGFDFRFGWSHPPDWVIWLGDLLFVAGFWLTAWAQGVNRHFELTVRIQTDREHKVIDSGPYGLIRHPGYIGGVALGAGTALALGSWVALIPVAICAVALAFRSLAEEAVLKAELPGYAEYMERIHYRWVPGLW